MAVFDFRKFCTLKIVCPFHKVNGQPERTPSLQLYPDGGYFCFACQAIGRIEDLDGNHKAPPETPKEDILASLMRIHALPFHKYRGLELPYDEEGNHYIMFPDCKYYLRRSPEGQVPKYVAPRGHAAPLFTAARGASHALLFVEGELNALSIATVCQGHTIVSPGSCSNFSEKWLTFCQDYDTIYLIVDKDAAGVAAGLKFKALLKKHVSTVHLEPWSRDANEILVNDGEEELRRAVTRSLGRF